MAEIGPSRHRSAQIKAYSACRRHTGPRELTKILPPTRNATAQPGRSWPRRREAFLPLARSYRMKGMPRASLLHCRGHRGGIAARIVMVRRREDGSELSSRSYLGQCDAIQRNDRRHDSRENRIQSGRSRIEGSGFKPAVPSRLFSCGGPATGRSEWVWRGGVDGA